MKKFLTSILTLLLSFSVLQAQSDDPQLINITTLKQLNAIRYDLDGDGSPTVAGRTEYTNAFGGTVRCRGYRGCRGYELMNDLDFKNGSTNTANFSIWAEGSTASDARAVGWAPIGYFLVPDSPHLDDPSDYSPFSAIFEGNGHRISNLYINRPPTDDFYTNRLSAVHIGLFGFVSGSTAELRNLGMVDVKVTGGYGVGGLVGWIDDGMVSGSYATGAVTGDNYVGGLVGDNSGDISNSYATGSVTGNEDVGGLVGDNSGDISNSYATGSVTGNEDVGGLVGDNEKGTVSNSYATGSVTGSSDVGGLVGWNFRGTVSNSYATGAVTGNHDVGGLVGRNISGTVTASYYNSETTGQSDIGKGKTTTELQTPTGYTGIYGSWDDGSNARSSLDDTDYWDFGTNGQYPVLKLDVDGNGIVGDADDLLAQRSLRFRQTSYAFAILNTASINDVVGIVRAVPEDANNELTYSMGTSAEFSISSEAETDNPFKVGQISVKADLSPNIYTLNVEVVEASGGTATVEVRIKVGSPLDTDADGLIEVSTLEQLNAIRYDLDGDGEVEDDTNEAAYSTAFGGICTEDCTGYELTNDLDFKNSSTNTANFSIWAEGSTASDAVLEGWAPIGYSYPIGDSHLSDDNPFSAIFEGNGHRISNLYINRPSTSYVGLFGYVRGSTAGLRNIGLLDVKVTGKKLVGGLVGQNAEGMVSNSYATGAVTGTGFFVGGLVGWNNQSTVSNSYATGAVRGSRDVGGLVGGNSGTVSNSYATGAVTGNEDVGGLVGWSNRSTVSNSYATGAVTGDSEVGGLVGYNYYQSKVSNSYATGAVTGTGDRVGGLVGNNNFTIIASYYNRETTGQSDTGKDEGKSTAELLTPTGYTGIYQRWNDGSDGVANNEDDTDYWNFGINGQYPVLKIDVDGNGTVGDATDLRLQRHPRLSVTPSSVDFGDVSTASTTSTMTYDLTGANLTEDVTLTIGGTNADLFSVDMTTISSSSATVLATTVTVTFTPTTIGDPFTAMITHSGGGLTSPLVVSLEGAGVPPPPVLGFATRAISNLRLSPNPVTGLLYVQGHGLGDMTVTLRSIAGKVHGSYTIRNTGKVPFSGLPSGMYIVQIVSQTGIITKQIIKSSGL